MSTQQGSPAAENPKVDLQPLAFINTHDDKLAAVYQAKIGNIEVPDEPVLELTVTIASPAGNEKAAQEIEKFLSEVRAGFAVTAPNPDAGQDASQGPDTFNVDKYILFDAELIRPDTSKVRVGVTVVIQTTIAGFTRSERILIALANGVRRVSAWFMRRRVRQFAVHYVPGSVTQGKCNLHQPSKPVKMKATVTSNSGSATVCPGNRQINRYGSYTVTAYSVTVCGVSPTCCYTVREEF